MNNERDCKHGQLARSCEICGLEAENAALRAELAAMRDQKPVYWQWRRKADNWPTDQIYRHEVQATTEDSEVRILYTAQGANHG